jgi:hypothetical protein
LLEEEEAWDKKVHGEFAFEQPLDPIASRVTLLEFSFPDALGRCSARVGAAGSERPNEVGVAARRGVPPFVAIGAGLRCDRSDANFDRP